MGLKSLIKGLVNAAGYELRRAPSERQRLAESIKVLREADKNARLTAAHEPRDRLPESQRIAAAIDVLRRVDGEVLSAAGYELRRKPSQKQRISESVRFLRDADVDLFASAGYELRRNPSQQQRLAESIAVLRDVDADTLAEAGYEFRRQPSEKQRIAESIAILRRANKASRRTYTKIPFADRTMNDERWIPMRSSDHWARVVVNRVRYEYARRRKPVPPFTIVTGASQNHAAPLLRFLRSIQKHEPGTEVIVYDLGLDDDICRRIEAHFPLRRFDFERYPAFFDISTNAGEFAWKPAIVREVAQERPDNIVCWMDAGTIVTDKVTRLRHAALYNGFYSPIGYWYFGDWVHPSMLDFFQLPHDWKYKAWTLQAGTVAFYLRNAKARQLLEDWAHYASIQQCIAPAGADRANHRRDQALLTALAYRAGLVPALAPGELGLLQHQDGVTQWESL